MGRSGEYLGTVLTAGQYIASFNDGDHHGADVTGAQVSGNQSVRNARRSQPG